MLQTLNFPAGGRQIDAKASFFRLESCNALGADESVRVRADGNDLGIFLPGDYVELPGVATRWEVIPVIATATGSVRLGMGRVGSSRLTGNVRVIDQSAEKTRAGGQYLGIASSGAAPGLVSVAGVYAGGGSGATAIKRMQIASSTAGTVAIGFATNRGTGLATVTPPSSKMNGAAGAVHRAAFGTIAGSAPTVAELPGWSSVGLLAIAANTYTDVVFAEPIVLSGNNCFGVIGQVANRDIMAIFHSEEF